MFLKNYHDVFFQHLNKRHGKNGGFWENAVNKNTVFSN